MLSPQKKAAIARAVNRGAALLDTKRKTWWRDILKAHEANSLDMASPRACVLGQAYGDYFIGLKRIALAKSEKSWDATDHDEARARAHGFVVHFGANTEVWSYLAEQWIRAAYQRAA